MTALLRTLALVAALAVCGAAGAAEIIRSYDVRIEVLQDGTIEVAETIAVSVEGNKIKRGIYRDFPVAYDVGGGQVALASFEVLEVLRNGVAETYHRSAEGAYARVRIGRANVLLPTPSEQVYLIRYRTRGQLRAHGGYDELYWNVTGDLWDFPILAASVEIRLPGGTEIRQHAAYTGRRGATGADYEVLEAADGVYRARTTAPLGRREGFTVAVGWPPGAVAIPPVQYAVRGGGGQYTVPMTLGGVRLGPFAAVAGTLVGALMLLLCWLRVGRDPPGGAIYPRFEPPPGLSPAATRYVKRYGFDPRCLTAAILSMAVKGAVRISERESASLFRDKEYTLAPLGAVRRGLSGGEKAAYRELFPGGDPLTLTTSKVHGARVDGARAELKSTLWDEHYGASFRRNTLYTFAGAAVGAVVAIVLLFITERGNMLVLLQWVLPAVISALLASAAGYLWFGIGGLRLGKRLAMPRLAKVIFLLVLAGVFGPVLASAFSFRDILASVEPGIVSAGAAFGVVVALFHFLMAAPSKAGRKIMDEIAGFELYMETAEEDRL
ncbi:MAG: DUF2207 domain-containing protein, partial [Paracoccaceae bacterium]